MSDTEITRPQDDRAKRHENSTRQIAFAVYILYLATIFLALTAIVGVVLAYVYRGDAPAWLESHYTFQIRTFWIGFLFVVISGLLAVFVIGYLLFLLAAIWLIIRCAKGISLLGKRRQVFDAETWLFP